MPGQFWIHPHFTCLGELKRDSQLLTNPSAAVGKSLTSFGAKRLLPSQTNTSEGISFLAKLVPSFSQGPLLIPGSLADPGKPGCPRSSCVQTRPQQEGTSGTPTRVTASETQGRPRGHAGKRWQRREPRARHGSSLSVALSAPAAWPPAPGQVLGTHEQGRQHPQKVSSSQFAGNDHSVSTLGPTWRCCHWCVLRVPP